jgi:UPF0755 protein
MDRLQTIPSGHRLALIAAGMLLLAVAVLLLLRHQFYQPLDSISSPTVLEISSGSSLNSVGNRLVAMEVLDSTTFFTLSARLLGEAGSIKAGEYLIEPGISMAELLALIVSGESIQYRVTLVEGWTFSQALAAIAELEQVEHTLAATTPAELAALLGLAHDNPEGMIHPDTYFFTRGTSDLELLRRARDRQQQLLDQAWERRLGALPYQDQYEAVIMASIVEKESSIGSERGHIAGVFVRRLELGMRLQSDPTVIYGMGADYAGNISRNDLNTTTPYNTYRINGLPPTPIALPGEESITASLNPLPSDYLYFVATGDGGHYFSSTLEEHNAAVARYQLNGEDAPVTQQ